MNFIPALLTINVTLFLLMAVGFFARKVGIITNESSKGLSRLIITIGQPMMIIAALEKASFSKVNLITGVQVVLISAALHILFSLMAYLICRKMSDKNQAKIFEFTLVFANVGFIGFPILDSILGDGIGSFMGAFFVISFHLSLWTWGIIILGRGREDIRMTPKKALINYGTIPCLVGVLLYLLKSLFELPDFFGKTFSYLGNLCTPISVLITGALIATMPLSQMFKNKRLYVHSAIKLLAFPIVICLLAKLCGLSDTYVLLATAMSGVPSAATVTMLADLYDIEPALASQTVGMTSILSTATLPLVMLFAQWVVSL